MSARLYRLTERQRKFVRGVAAGKTATQAAKDAGYSAHYANRQALQLLDNSQIRAYLAELTAKLARPAIADAEERQTWWTTMMRDAAQENADRFRASELLGRCQGDFTEKRITIPIVPETLTNDQLTRISHGEDPLLVLATTRPS